MTEQNIQIVRSYFEAVARGDIGALNDLIADDLVWHQPGQHALAGTHNGKDGLFALLGQFMERSGGTFKIDAVGTLMANGDLVATTLHFEASRGDAAMAMSGIDLLRLKGGKIAEVWLFSEDQAAEDRFWG